MDGKGGEILNHVILVGRLAVEPDQIKEMNDQTRMALILAVPRTFKNADGIYETDFIKIILWNGIAKRTSEYCKKGDLICVRGRIQVRSYEDEEANKKYLTEVIGESVAFIGTHHNSEKSDEEKN